MKGVVSIGSTWIAKKTARVDRPSRCSNSLFKKPGSSWGPYCLEPDRVLLFDRLLPDRFDRLVERFPSRFVHSNAAPATTMGSAVRSSTAENGFQKPAFSASAQTFPVVTLGVTFFHPHDQS